MKMFIPIASFVLFCSLSAPAAVVVGTLDTPVTENFSSYTGTGLNPGGTGGALDSNSVKILGMSDGDSAFGGTYGSGTDLGRGTSAGGVTTGGTYAFDIGGGNTALGVQPGGSDFTPGSITFAFQNSTGFEATSFRLEVDLLYFNDQTRGNTFQTFWSTDDATYLPLLQDITSPDAADGSPSWVLANSVNHVQPGLSIPDGSTFYIRVVGDDATGSGSRDEFALDNLAITLSGNTFLAQVPEPGSLGLLALGGFFLRMINSKERSRATQR